MGNDMSTISPNGRKAAWRFPGVIMDAKPPTYTVAFSRAWSVIATLKNFRQKTRSLSLSYDVEVRRIVPVDSWVIKSRGLDLGIGILVRERARTELVSSPETDYLQATDHH